MSSDIVFIVFSCREIFNKLTLKSSTVSAIVLFSLAVIAHLERNTIVHIKIYTVYVT